MEAMGRRPGFGAFAHGVVVKKSDGLVEKAEDSI